MTKIIVSDSGNLRSNCVYNEDNLNIIGMMPSASVDMFYCDPPFNTGESWAGLQGGYFDIYKNPVPAPDGFGWLHDAIDDKSVSYLAYMAHRFLEIKRVLKPTGHFFLHCDYREAGNLRVLGDSIFGKNNFKNEIIWSYPKSYAADQNVVNISCFSVSHNTILWWQASDQAPFYPLYTPYTLKQIREMFHFRDLDGRRYRTRREKGRARQYSDEQPGIPFLDVWHLNVASPTQRTGYSTEKPLPLLNRFVECSTQTGDLVCDPFCGSGTMLLAARNLDRKYIGIDISEEAVRLSERRLSN